MKARGWQQPAAEATVFGVWEQVVGPEVAAHCRPVKLEDGELTVEAESTAWATQLRLLAGKLLMRIAGEVGQNVVTQAAHPRADGAVLEPGPAPGTRPRPARHVRLTVTLPSRRASRSASLRSRSFAALLRASLQVLRPGARACREPPCTAPCTGGRAGQALKAHAREPPALALGLRCRLVPRCTDRLPSSDLLYNP